MGHSLEAGIKHDGLDISEKPMCKALAHAWAVGERRLVLSTIKRAYSARMSEIWYDGTAKALPDDQRADFIAFMKREGACPQ